MEQIVIFLTLIKDNWFISTIVILSILIITGSILKGLTLGMKVIFSLFILGAVAVMAFTLITFLS